MFWRFSSRNVVRCSHCIRRQLFPSSTYSVAQFWAAIQAILDLGNI